MPDPMADLAVRSVNLHDDNVVAHQVTGQTGPIGPGELDADRVELTETPEPLEKIFIAAAVGPERLHTQLAAERIDSDSSVGIEVGIEVSVDATGHQPRGIYDGHGHPLSFSWMARNLPRRRTTRWRHWYEQ